MSPTVFTARATQTVPTARRVTPVETLEAAVAATAATPTDGDGPTSVPAVSSGLDGYVVFRVSETSFAVSVSEVREVLRAARIELLPDSGRQVSGRALALVDIRGRSIPVLDLRSHRDAPGDVLIPMWRQHVGIVVDRVISVLTPRELVRETEDVPEALPSYARGVLRPVGGGAPVLHIAMPDVPELEADAARAEEARLGEDVLGEDVLGRDVPSDAVPSDDVVSEDDLVFAS